MLGNVGGCDNLFLRFFPHQIVYRPLPRFFLLPLFSYRFRIVICPRLLPTVPYCSFVSPLEFPPLAAARSNSILDRLYRFRTCVVSTSPVNLPVKPGHRTNLLQDHSEGLQTLRKGGRYPPLFRHSLVCWASSQ